MKTRLNGFKKFKTTKICVLAICLTFFTGYLFLDLGSLEHFNKPTNDADYLGEYEYKERIPLTSAYTLVDPINISSHDDWGLYPFITGNGSDVNPYIIENVEIEGNGVKTMKVGDRNYLNYTDRGIYINANGSFIIKNCKISSFSLGISLDIYISPEHNHTIEEVEIDNCGIGIYNYWSHFRVNISKCNITNCNWVTVKVPDVFGSPLFYGGFGIWVKGDTGSIIESCRVENCSIGLFGGYEVDIIGNQLINCGFLFDIQFMYVYEVILDNTVNGKPLGLFLLTDDLVITSQQASQYGQLIFQGCSNLGLSNFQITEACSFGLMITSCSNSILQNIVCENQKIGFLINTDYITANNLHTKNCDVGFLIGRSRHSTLNRLLTDSTDIPIYINELLDTTIQIEKSTWFYIIDFLALPEIQINSSISSVNLPRINLTAFELEGFAIQLNHTGTYLINDIDPHFTYIYFTVVIFDRYALPAIPGFLLIGFYTALLLGIIALTFVIQYKKRRV